MLAIWWEVNDGDFPPITDSVRVSFYPTVALSNIIRTKKVSNRVQSGKISL